MLQNKYNLFLKWLSPEEDLSKKEFEKIWNALTRYFEARGFNNSQDLADETILRLVGKLSASQKTDSEFSEYSFGYIIGFARNIAREHLKKENIKNKREISLEDLPEFLTPTTYQEQPLKLHILAQLNCMEHCLKQLPEKDKKLIVEYHLPEDIPLKVLRKKLSEKYNTSDSDLRVRIYRIRGKLRNCLENCLETKKN